MNASQKPNVEPLAYTIDDCSRAIGCGRSTVYELMAAGTLDNFKIGRRRLIRAESVRRLVGA